MDHTSKGDHLEVVAGRLPGSSQCYARAVQIKPRVFAWSEAAPDRRTGDQSWSLPFSMSGAVSSITPEILILRLRSGEHKMIRLDPQTRYLHDGQATDRGALEANRVVFHRAQKGPARPNRSHSGLRRHPAASAVKESQIAIE